MVASAYHLIFFDSSIIHPSNKQYVLSPCRITQDRSSIAQLLTVNNLRNDENL